jgi:integrase
MTNKIGIYKDPRNKGKPWVCRWFTLVDPESGKRKRFCKSFEFKRDAERFRAKKIIVCEQKGRPRANPEKQTLDAFLKSWLKRRKTDLKSASFELYEGTAKRLLDFFGKDSSLHDITLERADDFILAQKNIAPGREGNKLSDWTREQIKRHCKTFFGAAVQWGYLPANPFMGLRSKRLTTKRWCRVKPEEYHALLEVAPSLREKVAYALFYTAGLRLHEASNLTWDCIDFQKGILLVTNREATTDIPPFHIKDHEARRIPLPAHTIDLLTQWQTEAPESVPFVLLTRERHERVKIKWQTIRKKGLSWKNRYSVNNVLRNFKSHVKRAGVKPVGKLTVHTPRKCAWQNWADYLPMNVVKELMGHSNISTTQEFYLAVDRDHEKKAAQVVQKLLENNQNDVQVTYEADYNKIGGNR